MNLSCRQLLDSNCSFPIISTGIQVNPARWRSWLGTSLTTGTSKPRRRNYVVAITGAFHHRRNRDVDISSLPDNGLLRPLYQLRPATCCKVKLLTCYAASHKRSLFCIQIPGSPTTVRQVCSLSPGGHALPLHALLAPYGHLSGAWPEASSGADWPVCFNAASLLSDVSSKDFATQVHGSWFHLHLTKTSAIVDNLSPKTTSCLIRD